MRRREFITLLGGAATWPLAARVQQVERMRRVGALMNVAADDPESSLRAAAFSQGLQELGWTVGRNVRIDWRWGAASRDRYSAYAAELIALAPDVLLTAGATVIPMLQATRAVPIVFAGVNDPVGSGVVRSLARPGGNTQTDREGHLPGVFAEAASSRPGSPEGARAGSNRFPIR